MVVPKPTHWVALLLKWHPTSTFTVVLVTIASINMTFPLCLTLKQIYIQIFYQSILTVNICFNVNIKLNLLSFVMLVRKHMAELKLRLSVCRQLT